MNFSDATAVHQVDSHTYSAHFAPDWVIGSVPHGGYVTSCFQQVVRAHLATTLARQRQPHVITLHLEFVRRTQVGPATFTVRDVKLGRQTTVVHVSLFQDGREEVLGYFNSSDMDRERGESFPTQWQLHPPPPTVPDFARLRRDEDPCYGERLEWPMVDFRKATSKLRSWFPRAGQPLPARLDIWYSFRDGGTRFTNETLGFVCDLFPQILETFLMGGLDSYSVEFEKRYSREEERRLVSNRARFWYPTLLLNIEFKKPLPSDGVEFLFIRLQAKSIKNGRYDLEVLVLDQESELVAISNHVVFAVGAERNVAARKKADGGGSKL